MKIAFLQMDCVEGRAPTNRKRVEAAVDEAVAAGADLIVLPELWCSGYDLASTVGQPGWDVDFSRLAELSARIPIVGGSLLESAGDRCHNCSVAYENGEEVERYRKLHLFKPLDEPRWLAPGPSPSRVFTLAGLRCALAICYDLRFAEMFRPLAEDGVELICVPAQWPRARVEHWRALLVARAIENQCYVLGVNRRGWFRETEFPGHSLLVDPRGQIVVDAGEEPGLYYGEVDPAEVRQWREQFPVAADRRADLYP